MGQLASLDLGVLAAFTAAALMASVGAVLLSGFFPMAERSEGVRGATGSALVWTGVALTAGLAALALGTALDHLPWAVAVVAAGSAFLAAPFLVQPLPETLRDGKPGLVAFLVLGGLAIAALPGTGAL
jgi:hypothetical protein